MENGGNAMNLYSRSLTRSFDPTDGALRDLLDANFNSLEERFHKDLRAFHDSYQTVPWTMLDMKLHNADYFSRFDMGDFSDQRVLRGRLRQLETVGDLDLLPGSTIEDLTMEQIEFFDAGIGNESWTTDPDVDITESSSARYIPTIAVTLENGVEKIVNSFYEDDILTGLNSEFSTYFIELALPGLSADLDLDNSSLTFSSSRTFDPDVTDVIYFSQSEHALTPGNTYFRINRDLLANVDLENIRAIRFTLNATADIVFKARAMRVIDGGYDFAVIDTDTKKGVLSRSVPRNGATEPSDPFGIIWFPQTRPKNLTQVIKFHSGHNPSGNDNIIRFYLRNTELHQIRVDFLARNTQSRLRIYEVIGDTETEIYSTPTLSNALVAEKDYFLKIELEDTLIRASIYSHAVGNGLGAFPEQLKYTTGWKTVSEVERGGVGFSFEPYNYDFYLYYNANQSAEYAEYISTSFPSVTPVMGITLAVAERAPVDLIDEFDYQSSGDGVVAWDEENEAFKVTRDGSLFYGGIQMSSPADIVNTPQLYFTGEIFPTTTRGDFRIVILDRDEVVGFIGYIYNLRANTWNKFTVPVNVSIINRDFNILVHQDGFYPDTFYIRNLLLNANTVGWEVSGDKITWVNFRNLLNDRFFIAELPTPSTQFFIRAKAYSDDTWISEYEAIPFYKMPGHLVI